MVVCPVKVLYGSIGFHSQEYDWKTNQMMHQQTLLTPDLSGLQHLLDRLVRYNNELDAPSGDDLYNHLLNAIRHNTNRNSELVTDSFVRRMHQFNA